MGAGGRAGSARAAEVLHAERVSRCSNAGPPSPPCVQAPAGTRWLLRAPQLLRLLLLFWLVYQSSE